MSDYSSNSSNSSLYLYVDACQMSQASIPIFTSLFVSHILLLLPLFIIIFQVGYQRWTKQHSAVRSQMASHSDIFTFNMVALELITILGSILFCYATYTKQPLLQTLGKFIFSINSLGQTLFHVLTCVERYLAVVHPVTYLGLRQEGGVRIRNISIGCVWLICLASLSATHFFLVRIILDVSFVIFSSFVICFCSLSVLSVLIRAGPGRVVGKRERVDQTKQRALHTVLAIMGALLLRSLSLVAYTVLNFSSEFSFSYDCLMIVFTVWFSLPSSLVLPLLFLQRAGKLPCSKQNTEHC